MLAGDRALEGGKPEVLARQVSVEPGLGRGHAAGVLGLVKAGNELAGNPKWSGKIGGEARAPSLEAARGGPERPSLAKMRLNGSCSGAVECQADWAVC